MIAGIGAGKNLAYNLDMAFVLVPSDQKRVTAKILSYPAESDPGPYPIPDNAPVEGFRLRADFDVAGFPPHVQAILKGLKTYGMFVADNGGDWRLSVAPDSRIKGLDELMKVKGSDFEDVEPVPMPAVP